MAYIPSMDPENPERIREEAEEHAWDRYYPGWEVLSIDPEERSQIPFLDVERS